MKFIALPIAARRTLRSFDVKAPSLNAAWPNRLVVAMPTPRPVSSSAALKRATMRSRSAGETPHGIRSSSWRLTPQAPSSPSFWTESTGSSGSRVGPPNGSRPGLPTVQRPNVKRGSLVGDMVESLHALDDDGAAARAAPSPCCSRSLLLRDGDLHLRGARGPVAVSDRDLRGERADLRVLVAG